jgi:hypothetical protein
MHFAVSALRGKLGDSTHAEPHFGTPCHYQILFNSFIFKNEIEKEGLPGDITPALGAGGPGSNPGAPTTNTLNYLRLFLRPISTTIQLGNIWEQLVRFLESPYLC